MSEVVVVTDDKPDPNPDGDAVAFAAGAAAATAAVAASDAAQAQETADQAQATATAAATLAVETGASLAGDVSELQQTVAAQGVMINALALNALAQAEDLDQVDDELAPEKMDKPEPHHEPEPRHGMSKTWFTS
jgi:hypothetical protein